MTTNYTGADSIPISNADSKNDTDSISMTGSKFWCLLTIIPIKMSLRTFCVLQFIGDIIFGLLNGFIFFLASMLL